VNVQILHASCVAVQGRGVLILGCSGAGKSALALQLMAYGADLVSDDRTELTANGAALIARSPTALQGLIEARGLGLLQAPFIPQAKIALVIDLDQTETNRLPPERHISLLGISRPLVLAVPQAHFPAAILCYLKGHRFA
jgi:HPr kinase/phosphorylase